MAQINDKEYQQAKEQFLAMGFGEKEAAFNAAVATGSLQGDILDEDDDRFTEQPADSG